MGLASTTVPWGVAPCSIPVVPSTVTGSATVAAKPWPAWLWSELRPSLRRTVIDLPAGITIGCAVDLAVELEAPPDVPGAAELSVEDPGVAGFVLPPPQKKRNNPRRAKKESFGFSQPPPFLEKTFLTKKRFPRDEVWGLKKGGTTPL